MAVNNEQFMSTIAQIDETVNCFSSGNLVAADFDHIADPSCIQCVAVYNAWPSPRRYDNLSRSAYRTSRPELPCSIGLYQLLKPIPDWFAPSAKPLLHERRFSFTRRAEEFAFYGSPLGDLCVCPVQGTRHCFLPSIVEPPACDGIHARCPVTISGPVGQ